nr:MAG TPA: hypothetical protein [Caudoviricetes sp.]
MIFLSVLSIIVSSVSMEFFLMLSIYPKCLVIYIQIYNRNI